MRTLKLTTIAAVAILATAASGQVRAGVYDYGYTPTYSSYPVSSGTYCPSCTSGQCPSCAGVPSYSYAPSYSYPTYSTGTTYGTGASCATGTCPNGSCGANGACCANGRCGTCPAGTCRSGNCPANCPNGQCTSGRNRDLGASVDAPIVPSYTRPDYSPPAPRFAPSSWSPAPAPWRSYDERPSDRFNTNLESPFYN